MNRPAFFTTLALVAGIAAAGITRIRYLEAFFLLLASEAAYFVFHRRSDKLLFIVFFLLGTLLYSFQNTYFPGNSITRMDIASIRAVKVIVEDDPEQSDSKIYFYGKLISVETADGENTAVSGKIRVTLEKTIGAAPEYGDILLVKGKLSGVQPPKNPGEFDYKKYLAYKQVYFTIYAKDTAAEKQGRVTGDYFKYFSYQCKKKLLSIIYSSLPDAEARVLDGLMLGNQRAIPDATYDEFKITGTVHILAVSGMNVGMIALFAFFFLKLAGVNRKIAAAITMVLVLSFMVITGAGGSIVRSALMSCMVLLGVILERDGDTLNSISIAAFAILLVNPSELYDVGFVMSFLAAFGIIYALEWTNTVLPNVHPWIKEPLATTIAAQLFLTPVMADTFHQVSVIAVAANLAIVPLSGTISIIGYAMWIFGFFSGWIAHFFGASAWALIRVMLFITHWAAEIPYAAISVKTLPVLFVIIYYALFLVLPHNDIDVSVKKISLKKTTAFLLALWAVLHIIVPSHPALYAPAFKGIDAVFIQTPDNKKTLILGRDNFRSRTAVKNSIVPFLRYLGVNNIDVLIAYSITEKENADTLMRDFRVWRVYADRGSSGLFPGAAVMDGGSHFMEGVALIDINEGRADITVRGKEVIFLNNPSADLTEKHGAIIYVSAGDVKTAGLLSGQNNVVVNTFNSGYFRRKKQERPVGFTDVAEKSMFTEDLGDGK
jgi:competence protein ComEC